VARRDKIIYCNFSNKIDLLKSILLFNLKKFAKNIKKWYIIDMKLNIDEKNQIEKIANRYKLKLVILFGSLASGQARYGSDAVVMVLFEKEPNLNIVIALTIALEKVLKYEVDLSIANHANPLLLRQVEKNSILLFGKRSDFFNFKLNAFHRYNDYKPYFELEEKVNKKIIAQYVHR